MNDDSKPFKHYEFLEACKETGCPVCRLGAQTVGRQLKFWFYEYINDRGMRASLVKSLGFCAEHTGLLLGHKIADSLGAAIIYEHLVKVVLREFPKASSSTKELSRKIGSLVSASEKREKCLACQRRDESVNYTLRQIAGALDNPILINALETSDGLCFPHLSQLLPLTKKKAEAELILNLTKTKLEMRQAEMAEVVRKNDHRFNSEAITDEEAMAWKKAMTMLSGVSINALGKNNL